MRNPYRTALIAILSLTAFVIGLFIIFAPPLTVCLTVDGIGGPCIDWMGGAPMVYPIENINPLEL